MRAIILLLLLCTGCNFKPYYHRPPVLTPPCWRFDQPCAESVCANIRWWEQFQDPILDALIVQALRNNEDLQLATARVLTFYSRYREVASQLYPQINAQASYEREKVTQAVKIALIPPGISPITNLYTLALNLTYEIDFWGRIRNATESALAIYLSKIEARRTVILTLVSTLASAYFQLRQYDAQLEVSQKTYKSRLESLRLSKLRFEVGLVSEMEVKQAEAEAQSAETQVVNFERLIPIQEDLISVLLGVPPSPIVRGPKPQSVPPCVPTGIPAEILNNRPDILQAELELIAANAQIGVARAAFFPAISLTGLFGVQSSALKNLFSQAATMWDYALSATQPIFTGYNLTYHLREAEALTLEALHNYRQTVLTAFQEVSDSLINFQKTQELVEVKKKEVAALEEYLKLATLRYENGQNDYLTVLDAERFLFRSELELVAFQSDVYLSLIDIYKALGGGWVIDADCLTKSEVRR